MRIIEFERSTGFAGDGRILARFSVQVLPELRLCGLRLVETANGLRTFFPSVNGGGRSTTTSPEFARKITAAASARYEGLQTANGTTSENFAA